jgi:hypothetical protein
MKEVESETAEGGGMDACMHSQKVTHEASSLSRALRLSVIWLLHHTVGTADTNSPEF